MVQSCTAVQANNIIVIMVQSCTAVQANNIIVIMVQSYNYVVFLDIPRPWDAIEASKRALKVLCYYVYCQYVMLCIPSGYWRQVVLFLTMY